MPGSLSLIPSAASTAPTTRQVILAAIQSNEGLTKTQLAKTLDLGWGTICHHLVKLEKARAVRAFHHGRNTHLFPTTRSRKDMEAVVVQRHPAVQRILGLLRERTELTMPTIMEKASLSRYVANASLAEMEEIGLVVRVGTGRPRYRAPDRFSAYVPDATQAWGHGPRAASVMD